MKIEDTYKGFRRKLTAAGKRVTGLTPSEGFHIFQQFYAADRVSDAQPDQGDGLAVYFGMSRDGGAVYEVGMVRVFRKADVAAHEANARLRLSFSYPFVETVLRGGLDKMPGWPEGTRYCWTPSDQSDLDSFIGTSGPIQAVLTQPPRATKLRLENLWGTF
ncbi:hypothetical protein [Burkholderia cepacia]|uniref:hypothetical protein n=1 Tax=Burkholderia cepacia TaxID=292 RepID=UPI000A9E8387|nr:hypothetical protein [Burkholderia cepacia]